MAVTYGFFNSVNGDRKYNADTMSEFYTGICSPGVFQSVDNGLAVSAGTGLNVSVATGRAIVQKHWLKNDAALTLAISAASTTYARIDAVVIRFNSNNRNITIAVKDGTPSASPSAPSMTRAGGVYEMALAYVNVAAGATSVTVTDKRADSSVCGWATVAQSTSGEVDQMLDDMKTGFDGVVYPSPVEMVQGCDQFLQNQIDDIAVAYNNLFRKSHASIISVMGNSSGDLVSGGGVSSVAIKVKPNTQYTLSFWGGNRRLLWETETYPVVGGHWVVNDGEMSVSSETIEGNSRYYKTLTTGSTTNYLLLYFYTSSSGAENVLNTIQLEEGTSMTEYKDPKYYTLPNLVLEGIPETKLTNYFNKSDAEIVSIAVNATTLQFVSGGGVSSVVCPCKPNTAYTIAWRSIDSKSRFFIAPSNAYPTLNGYATSRIEMTNVSSDGRYYATVTTGANDNYFLLWFYSETTGGEATLDSIQVNLGSTLLDYTGYGFVIEDLNVSTKQIYGDPFSVDMLPDYVINNLGYRELGALDKGYICLVADDGTSDIASVSFAIAQNKEVPITFALWSTSACIVDSSLLAQLRTMLSDYDCSVAQHGVGNFATDYTTDSLIEYLNNEKEAWDALNIEPKGMVYPNHGNNAKVRAICGGMYDVCCTGGVSANKDHVYPNDTLGTRSNMFALYRVSTYSTTENTMKTMCDYAYSNNKIIILWWHDNDIVNDQSQITKINNVIDYAKTKGLEFITVGDIPTL